MNFQSTESSVKQEAPTVSPIHFEGKSSWMDALCLNPFRLFFPLALLFGLIGVGQWVFWSVGWKIPEVAFTHAALQSEGFLTCFVVGFLMTAFPRFTGTRSSTKIELSIMTTSILLFFGSVLAHRWLASQIFFLSTILNLILFTGQRVSQRTKKLPAPFLLMGFGFLHALLGALLILFSHFGMSNYVLFSIGRQMVQLGFLLCVVLGVTGKLAPYLLGYTDSAEEESNRLSWLKHGNRAVAVHSIIGAGVLISFFVEGYFPRIGLGIRAVLVSFHLLTFARIARPLKKKTTLMFFFFLSLWMIPLGLWCAFLIPQYRIAALHIIFLGGFTLMIFSFGLLIVLSHTAKAAVINDRLLLMRYVGGFILTALVLRIGAVIYASQYKRLIHFSSGFWLLATIIWTGLTLPKILDGWYKLSVE